MTAAVAQRRSGHAEGGPEDPPDLREDGRAGWAAPRRTGRRLLGPELSVQVRYPAPPEGQVFDFDGVQVFVDPKSILYLHGMTLDYKESLMQSGFVFENPNAKKNCGCGTSFAGVNYFRRFFDFSNLPRQLYRDRSEGSRKALLRPQPRTASGPASPAKPAAERSTRSKTAPS